MVGVLRNPTYARLFIAQVVALLGTGLLTVALGLLAFDLAGRDAGAVMGTALTIKMVAYVGVAPVVAALVDQIPKKAVLVGADLIRFAVALLLPFVAEVWQIYVLVFVLQSASATFTPAFQSLIPAVLPDERQYTRALSLSRLAYDLESLLSPAIAAALLAVVSYHDLFVGTAIGFAGSIVFVLLAHLPAAADTSSELPFWRRLREGAGVFARTRTLWFLMCANVAVAAGTALVMVNTVVYVRGVMNRGDSALGLALACYGMGSLLVAVATPRVVERIGVIRTMSAGIAVTVMSLAAAVALTVVVQSTGTGWEWLLGTWFALGIGTSLINTPSSRLLADASSDRNRNLVYTAQFALSHACFLLTYPIAGQLGASSLTFAASALAAIAVLAAVAATVVARRGRPTIRPD
ncbi:MULTISPECIES: MFS transporter [Dietzia]|uniref:MFS transporter n=1 Tax=Dietzia TaxID=37914 RepID=UPI00195761A2|nr:MFS transporter [Dietzia kunjamensis]MBM7231063.1 MFS transporter [Dietzia cinnamea]